MKGIPVKLMKDVPRLLKAACALTCIASVPALSSCGGNNNSQTAGDSVTLENMVNSDIDKVLPAQDQIKTAKPYAYLMANPTPENFKASEWVASPARIPDSLKGYQVNDPSLVQQVNEKCSVYEQVAVSSVATPSGDFTVIDGKRRRITVGQIDVNQISGYNSILRTASNKEATDLYNQFKSNAADCSLALNELYPLAPGGFELQQPIVDGSSGITRVNGSLNGTPISLILSVKDNYLISTTFKSADPKGPQLMGQAGPMIHELTLKNIQNYT